MLFTEIAGAPFHYPSAPMSPPSAFWSTGEAPSNYSQKSRYCNTTYAAQKREDEAKEAEYEVPT